ncbi:hypothetical protein [Azospirillum argentinense]|uniref:nucleotidyltransferase family protein n=1 Tax=Azospirillum argentinense TaxID=2970906 RepID=UPI0032DFE3F2
MKIPSSIRAIRLFGSTARGDSDAMSDVDVLVILANHAAKKDIVDVEIELRNLYGGKISISWYGEHKYRSMHSEGHLFCWHIFLESKRSMAASDIVDELGTPRPYMSALQDIEAFIDILEGCRSSVRTCEKNATYESGVIYTCARNIAMYGSWMSGKVTFSRLSPYILQELSGIRFPLSRMEYEQFARARISLRAEVEPFIIKQSHAITAQSLVFDWAMRVIRWGKGANQNGPQ